MDKPEFQPRSSERLPVVLLTRCRTGVGSSIQVVMSDISTGGCCISTGGHEFKPGSRVTLQPEGLEGIPARICWVRDSHAGVQFERPLYQPIVEHLHRQHLSFGAASPKLSRFARQSLI